MQCTVGTFNTHPPYIEKDKKMKTSLTETATPLQAAPPAFRYSFTIKAETSPAVLLSSRTIEQLEYIPITGGQVSGEITGQVSAGGGDWCLQRADDVFQVEARYGFICDSGDYVDVLNTGLLRHLDGESGDATEMRYFVTSPVFRTTSPGLQWLTRSMFIGQAIVFEDNTTIDFYEVLTFS